MRRAKCAESANGGNGDAELLLDFLGGDTGEIAGAVEHAGGEFDKAEVTGGDARLHRAPRGDRHGIQKETDAEQLHQFRCRLVA